MFRIWQCMNSSSLSCSVWCAFMAKVERFSSGSGQTCARRAVTSPLLWCVRFCVREPQPEPQSIDCKKQAVMHKCITACFIIIWRRGWDSNPRAPIKGQLDFESSALRPASLPLRRSGCSPRDRRQCIAHLARNGNGRAWCRTAVFHAVCRWCRAAPDGAPGEGAASWFYSAESICQA